MNVETLETRIYEFEEVRVCIRAPWNEEVGAYTLERKAAGNMSLNAWLDSRVRPLLNGLHVYAIAGDGGIAHGRTRMETLRNSYAR